MKLYYLQGNARLGDARVDISDKQNRISGYFIWNDNDGKFLNFSVVSGIAQEGLSEETVLNSDYLPCNMSIPIFSERAKSALEREISDEVKFYPLMIDVNGKKINFVICKTLKYFSIIDSDASHYRTLRDGTAILTQPVFKRDIGEEFHIARDIKEKQVVVVSEKFRKHCDENGLLIDFIEAKQS